jgi:hypothetical protein
MDTKNEKVEYIKNDIQNLFCALSKLAEKAKIHLIYMFEKVVYAAKSFI